jgi:hypothetical protein
MVPRGGISGCRECVVVKAFLNGWITVDVVTTLNAFTIILHLSVASFFPLYTADCKKL